MKIGGLAMAWASVLKLVRMVQRIGKKISRPIVHGTVVFSALRCVDTARAMVRSSSRVQVLADDAHQEDGNDIGKDDGIDPAGRSEPHVLAFQHALEDQVGERPGAEGAAGGDED